MKGTFFISLIVVFSMLAIPLSSVKKTKDTLLVSAPQNETLYEIQSTNIGFEKIKVLKDNSIIELSSKDYIFGVVAAEMPALYSEEALKAQAVAAYTFACYKLNSASNQDYDITADPKTAQCFITREEATLKWGENATEYTQKIDNCISAVLGEVLTYKNEPIFAAYHAISPGSTNSCNDVFGQELPYLQSVDSASDCLSDKFLSEVNFSLDELCEALNSIGSPTGDAQNFFSNINSTTNGYVKTLQYCNKEISGSKIAELLGLRSSNFEIKYSENVFTFTVKGYGHGVGMSQTGADYMAKQGSSYKEILLHYYKDAVLQKN